jgi:hypothetical protein
MCRQRGWSSQPSTTSPSTVARTILHTSYGRGTRSKTPTTTPSSSWTCNPGTGRPGPRVHLSTLAVIFVPRPGHERRGEDDGVLLTKVLVSTGYTAQRECSGGAERHDDDPGCDRRPHSSTRHPTWLPRPIILCEARGVALMRSFMYVD